jgi:choline dehydrogenase-like flavoprotein
MTTEAISSSQVNDFDYVIVGGGTAGCVIASRLSDYLPSKKILLVEAGPSDFNDDRVLKLKDWLSLLGGELDYDYGTTEQPNGKSLLNVRFHTILTVYQETLISDTLALKSWVVAARTIH